MPTDRPQRLLVLWALLLALAPAVAHAQTGAASITGLVTDETGGALPGVTVTATNQATNVAVRRGLATRPATTRSRAVLVGTLRREGRAHRVPDGDDHGRSRSRRGRSRASTSRCWSAPIEETVEVTGARAHPADRDGDGRRGASRATPCRSLPLNGRNTGAAGAAAARRDDLQPARVHQHRRHQLEPAVRQRQPRADQQLHGRRPRRQRDDRQPRRLPAEPRRAGRDQRRDQQLHGRDRQRRRRRRQQRASSRAPTTSAATCSSSTATATSTRTRGRTTGRARPSRSARSTSPAARSAGRS